MEYGEVWKSFTTEVRDGAVSVLGRYRAGGVFGQLVLRRSSHRHWPRQVTRWYRVRLLRPKVPPSPPCLGGRGANPIAEGLLAPDDLQAERRGWHALGKA